MNRQVCLLRLRSTIIKALLLCILLRQRRRKRRWNVRPALKLRARFGWFHSMYPIVRRTDKEYFASHFRMSPECFDVLFDLVNPFMKPVSSFRTNVISTMEQLLITLLYLMSGDSQKSISRQFVISKQIASVIIRRTCISIWNALNRAYLPCLSATDFLRISDGFAARWNFPHCCGCLDGKHVRIKAPWNSGTKYYNFKGFFSINLMAMCDSQYSFTMIDVGGDGSLSDARVFADSPFGQGLTRNRIPRPVATIPEDYDESLEYVLLGDEGFPLKPYLLRPFARRNDLSDSQKIFNYRLSRCRRTVENSFGILSQRFRIFHSVIQTTPEAADFIVKSSCILHNFLLNKSKNLYAPPGYTDITDEDGNIINGEWRAEPAATAFAEFSATSNNPTADAVTVRDSFMRYFESDTGKVDWQMARINRGKLPMDG